MLKKRSKMTNSRLRVSYSEASRVRVRLLSEDVQTLSKRDVQTLLKILDDVYPVAGRASRHVWQPLLVGIGIGLIVLVFLAFS